MRKEEKSKLIDSIAQQLEATNNFYLADISGLDSEQTTNLRRLCFKQGIKLQVVKNTFLKKAFDKIEKDVTGLEEVLSGNTAIMFTEAGNAPAKLIKEYTKKFKLEKPEVKGAFIEETTYVGADQLDFLASIKSKNELLGELIGLLQSPAKNVISGLQSGGNTIHGLLETLADRPE